MTALVRQAAEAARSGAVVLVTGERGAGREFIARLVHGYSARAGAPFDSLNCATATEAGLESALFDACSGGTLLLKEAGSLPVRLRALLMRALSGAAPALADVRLIVSASPDLAAAAAGGTFREDLLSRLQAEHLHVPPLRERVEDIPPLVTHFLSNRAQPRAMSDAALDVLMAYRWPGNVRELADVVAQAAVAAARELIAVEDLPAQVRGTGTRTPFIRERRRQVADEIFDALVTGRCAFWEHVHPLFLARDLTRHDVRELVRCGLARTRGNYRALLTLFGMAQSDYKKFLNFLAAHDCGVDFRPYRSGRGEAGVAGRRPGLFTAGESVRS